MGKRLDITPKIAAALARSSDGSVDPATVAVFQTEALNTLPVSKKGTLFDGGRISETTLHQMASYLNAGTDSAPLHQSHDQGEGAMPIGRVFAGDVSTDVNGIAALHNLFYLPLSETSLIEKLETNVINEVSVGLKPQHINCSECGFDYLGAESTWENIYYRMCGNEHEVGVNGVHTISNGMDKYMELSLVSRGAASKTKILSRAKAYMGQDELNRLAASGIQPELTVLFASPTTHPKELDMDLTTLVNELTTVKASVLSKDSELVTTKETVVTLTTQVTDLTAQLTALKDNADVKKVEELTAKLTAAESAGTAALEVVRKEAVRLTTAAGLPALADDANLETLTASITTARTKLQEALPVGGASLSAKSQQDGSKSSASNNSFKTRK